jgi:DNA-binding transcriptional LysR family regulator
VAQTTDDQFSQLEGRIKGRGDAVTGELIITTLSALAPLVIPTLKTFQDQHPELVVRLLTGERVFRLEYGEAHVALRAGTKPDEPDNVVQDFLFQDGGMYATQGYIDAHGLPATEAELRAHRWVCHDSPTARAPFDRWIRETVPAENIVFRATEQWVMQEAVLAGAGIGFFPRWLAAPHPELVEVLPPRPEWAAPLWLVTHVDLHRTVKVQSFTKFLKEEAQSWPI